MKVWSSSGNEVAEAVWQVMGGMGRVRDLRWDGGSRLLPGVYIYELLVRSLQDQSSGRVRKRLIVRD